MEEEEELEEEGVKDRETSCWQYLFPMMKLSSLFSCTARW